MRLRKAASLAIALVMSVSCVFAGDQNQTQEPVNQNQEQEFEPYHHPDYGEKHHYLKTKDNIKIHYVTLGKGKPILLIHGFMASAEANWFRNGIAQELAKTNFVIAIDNRGHGKSDKPIRPSQYGGNMWRDALAVLDDLKIDKAHIHGYSMGGSILTQILYHAPKRVLSAVYGGNGVPEFDKEERKKIKKDLKLEGKAKEDEKKALSILRKTIKHNYVAMWALRNNAPWSGGELQKIDLTKVTIPVIALNGIYDKPNSKTYRMKRDLKNFRSVVFPGKGHLTTVTPGYMPKEYLIELTKFIRKL